MAGIALVLISGPTLAQRPVSPTVEIDRIVAVVNGDVIVWSELAARVRAVRAQLAQSGTAVPSDADLVRQVLERLIMDRLQLQLAETNGIRVDDETLNRAVASIAERNRLSLREFREVLERDGYDFGKFREEIRNELLIGQVRQRFVNNRVTVSQRDIDNFLAMVDKQGRSDTEYRLAHILVALPEAASPEAIAEARTKAERILADIDAGADFARTAVATSDGQQALQGGDLGWRRPTELPTFLGEVVPTLKPGEVSRLIRSPSGFHIVKLIDQRGSERHVVTRTRASHILIRPNEAVSAEEARIRLEQIRERVVNGEPFADLARAHSDDAGSAANGGELGWVSPGDLLPDFQKVMDALPPGQVSQPFQTQFGWHIVQVNERKDFDDTEQARRSAATQAIRDRKIEEELQNWLRQIRDEAFVEYRLEQ
ncbi:MAG: peptidylprolyl isomerase [Ectothiorhodospiraceae bacterium]|nr:peptidylprolyl isomerase [Ectothiorhodospiraceae bacterium]